MAVIKITTSEGYDIFTAENAAEALAVVSTGNITLIISDY